MKTKQLTVAAVLVAVNLVLSYVVKVPTPTGFVSLVESGIFLAAWLYGPRTGAIVGGLTGFLLDLLAGYPQWMVFSLLIHGTEGWFFGRRAHEMSQRVLSTVVGTAVMVLGYWVAGAVILWITSGLKISIWAALLASTTEMPGNLAQVLAGFVVAGLVYLPVKRVLHR